MLLPEGASTIAPEVDRLFWIILWITGFFFFLVQGCLLLFVLKYHSRGGQKAAYVHGNAMVEVVWTVVPAVILLLLTVASQKVWAQIRSPRPITPGMIQVEVLAEQFAWNVRYPGPDGQFDTSDDITTINQLHLPVGRPALVRIRSKDVIHSFFVPQFRIKQDAVPGLPTQVWLEPTKAGEYELRCAELCGLGHYRMRGYVTTEPEEQFQKWLTETKANE
ncbi:MAG: cytochrome c oxidase subunit II [Candidatus Omnitrophica bacterium]|nr:cytochrome c oxidase subunit II [Candidatus Omnitrophota bacterium]